MKEGFVLPIRLRTLLAVGFWPTTREGALAQNSRSLVTPARVRLFAADESTIYFERPPFRTLADEVRSSETDFWSRFGALDQIDPSRVLVIGDFGIGSDSPIILDYRDASVSPPVLRLRWPGKGMANTWVQGAKSFDDFADMLGLPDPAGSQERPPQETRRR